MTLTATTELPNHQHCIHPWCILPLQLMVIAGNLVPGLCDIYYETTVTTTLALEVSAASEVAAEAQ